MQSAQNACAVKKKVLKRSGKWNNKYWKVLERMRSRNKAFIKWKQIFKDEMPGTVVPVFVYKQLLS